MFDENAGLFAFIAIFLGLIGAMIHLSVHERREWERFSAIHHCRLSGHMDGNTQVGNSFDFNGNVGITVASNPDKAGYTCDDGMTYWRDE